MAALPIKTLHIPAKQWPLTITAYLAEWGAPAQVVPHEREPMEADEVHWRTDAAGLHCLKIELLAASVSAAILHNPNFPDATDATDHEMPLV